MQTDANKNKQENRFIRGSYADQNRLNQHRGCDKSSAAGLRDCRKRV